jgi:hypothetical protein
MAWLPKREERGILRAKMGSYQKEKKSHEDILRTQEEVPCHIPELT